MADPKFFDWFEGDAGTTRSVDFGDGQHGIDLQTPTGIKRKILTPSGATAESFIPLNQQAVTPVASVVPNAPVAPAAPVKPVLPTAAAAPVISPVAAPFGSEYIPAIPRAPAAPTAPQVPQNSYVTAAPTSAPLRTPRKDGRSTIDAQAMPRIFNPLALDPFSPTSPVSATEPGAQKLYDYLKTSKKSGYAVKGKGGPLSITGKNPGELATNWVSTMKNLRRAGDKEGVSQMQNIASYLFE